MIVRVLIGTLLVTVLQVVWGNFVWASSGWPLLVLRALPHENALLAVLKEHLPVAGDYCYPWPSEPPGGADEQQAAWAAFLTRHQEGPLVRVSYRPHGVDLESPVVFAAGCGYTFLATLLVATLLALAAPGLPTFSRRLTFILLLGLFAALGPLGDILWFHRPWPFPLFLTAYVGTSWLLAAPFLAFLIKVREVQRSPGE